MQPRDHLREVMISGVCLSPDGQWVVFAQRTARARADRSGLWRVPYAGGRPERVTDGAWTDSHPRFSPDGRHVAFLSDRSGGTVQLWLMPSKGGRPRRLTRFRRGVSEFDWAPDGRWLAVCAHDDDSHLNVGERGRGEPTARVLRRLDWRNDGDGLLTHPTHVHRVAVEGGTPQRLTSGPWFASRPRVAPDGSTVAFLADLASDADVRPHPQVHAVSPTGGRMRRLTRLPGPVLRFAFDPGGGLTCIAHQVPMPPDDDPQVLYRVSRRGDARPLSRHLDRFAGTCEADAGRVTTVHDMGRDIPYRFGDRGCEPLVDASLGPEALELAAAGERVAAVMSLPGAPWPEVYAIEPGGQPRRLTTSGNRWLRRHPRAEQQELLVDGPGGTIQTFLLSPPGAAHEPLPTVLEIHGGPTWAWGVAPTLNAIMLAAAGYRVARPNIRGSYNRGREWIHALCGDWGGVDAEDCHAVLDHLVEAGLADPTRLGCLGNSYGGFMVNWLVGTSDRFAAAVSQNGVSNQVSGFGNSDCGATYDLAAGLGDVTQQEGVESLWRQSPLRHVAEIRTPLLLLQAEADLRCPAADAEQLFVALRWLGREVEYVLYPEATHSLTHTARPDRRVDRLERMLDWFGRHMAG